MKKVIIIILLFSIFLIGCRTISADTIVSTTAESTLITETTINDEYITLKAEYDKLVEDNNKLVSENEAYNYLIRNLNNLLRNIYCVYGENSGGSIIATGFSLYYKGKYYLITAGHVVNGGYGKFENLKFKANFSNEWVYPKLLTYENNRIDPDYAIFYSNKITDGFLSYSNNTDGKKYILGSENVSFNSLKEFDNNAIDGESGSPIINLDQELIGTCIHQGDFTKINIILSAIDNLK